MNKQYWEEFYKTHKINTPSSFAKFALQFMPKNGVVIDVGCGSGRDSYFFAQHGLKVLGVDYASKLKKGKNVTFLTTDVNTLTATFDRMFDVVYSRFFLHAIEPQEVQRLIKWSKGLFMAECRAKGDEPIIYKNHKRNLIDGNKLLKDLISNGFNILYYSKSYNVAKYKGEDPLIIRVIAQK